MKIVLTSLIVTCLAVIGLAQESKPTGRIGGAPSDAGADVIKGRIGGAPSDAGADTISGRVGGGAATEAGGRTPVGIRDTNATGRASLSGDPFTTRGALGSRTNILSNTNQNLVP